MSHTDLIKDSDGFFEVDAITRQIINKTPSKIVLMQHDHNSERFTFLLPRYIEGHDMAQSARAVVHYINIENSTGNRSEDSYRFYDLQINPDDESTVICTWLISGNATMYAGQLTFLVEFDCYEDDELVYSWHSASYKSIAIGETFECDEAEHYTQYADIIAQWEQMLFGANEDGVTNINEARDAALDNINNTGEAIMGNIIDSGADALNNIITAKNEVLEEIESKNSHSVDADGNASFNADVKSVDTANIIHSLNNSAKGIVNSAEGTNICLSDSAEAALVDLSIDTEGANIYVTGNNLFNPVFLSTLDASKKETINDNGHGTTINSTKYTGEIVVTQKTFNSANSNIHFSQGYFCIKLPLSHFQINKSYTFIADVEVTNNADPNGNTEISVVFGGNNIVDVSSGKICIYKANKSSIDSNQINIRVGGKSLILKNIMLLPGDWTNNPPEYEDCKEQVITNVKDYKNAHTYYPITRIINDTDANMSVKYVADTKSYIDNKIDNKIAELQKTLNATT